MIKRYNQFVKGKVNEDYEFETEAPVRTIPSLGKPTPSSPEVAPGTIEKPLTIPSKPSPFRRDKPSTEPGTKAEFEGEEEEVGVDKYEMALQTLADLAGAEFNSGDKVVVIDNKEVTYPAETEKYHIKGVKKSFDTPEDVLTNLGGAQNSPTERKQEVEDEMNSIKDEEVLDQSEQFESKSYKSKRFKK
jgi:hypothetical protein